MKLLETWDFSDGGYKLGRNLARIISFCITKPYVFIRSFIRGFRSWN